MDERQKIIYTYNNAWNVEKRIYSLGDFKLPRSVALETLGFILIGLVLGLILSKVPIIGTASPLVLYGACLVGFPILMRKARIHSKTPAKFIVSLASYLMQPKSMTRFQAVKRVNPVRFTNINFRR